MLSDGGSAKNSGTGSGTPSLAGTREHSAEEVAAAYNMLWEGERALPRFATCQIVLTAGLHKYSIS